jgi:hypothetical protein
MLERFPHEWKPLQPILASIFTHMADSSRMRSALACNQIDLGRMSNRTQENR